MKASQEAQAAAYKEMTKSNKMRDNDAVFHSIEVYDGSNPAKFEKWIDSIDQATHITFRDLRKELLKKSDGVIRNTLLMMGNGWSDMMEVTHCSSLREELWLPYCIHNVPQVQCP